MKRGRGTCPSCAAGGGAAQSGASKDATAGGATGIEEGGAPLDSSLLSDVRGQVSRGCSLCHAGLGY